MQANWNTILSFILQQEGGFENNPDDPGVWTGNAIGSGVQIGSNLGISAATLAGFYPDDSAAQLASLMVSLTAEQAGSIYSSDYWQAIQGDELPTGIDLMLMDDAVNKGVSAAVQTIQSCLDVESDGDLGPLTLAAITTAPSLSALALHLGSAQALLYLQDSEWAEFGNGWAARWGARMQAATALLAGD